MNTIQNRHPGPSPQRYPRSAAARRPGVRKKPEKQTIGNWLSLLYLPLYFLVSELILKFSLFGSISFKELFYLLMFSFAGGILMTSVYRAIASGIATLAENRDIIRPLTACLIGATALFFTALFLVQYVYFSFFGDFFKWSTLGLAADITDFYREIITTVLHGWYWVLLLIAPIVLFFLFPAKKFPSSPARAPGILFLLAFSLLFHFGAVAVINLDTADYGDSTYYHTLFNAPYSVKAFGLLTETRLDLKELLFGGEEEPVDPVGPVTQPDVIIETEPDTQGDSTGTGTETDAPIVEPPIEYGYNIMDIDFEKLIATEKNKTILDMHQYFSSLEGTKQNKYTGYFEGKNLIFVTLEGFSYRVVDPTLTPTLYEMTTNGFVFNNFYNSLWGGSTATGEYAAMTGNFYKSANCLKQSGSTYQPFSLGNLMKQIGYKTTAYHNHTYTYYSRNLSHPNFGYNWIALGNGLKLPSNVWPNSDLEMAQVTGPEYVGTEPFLTYYMTVSGHANYSFMGNSMSAKHRLEVQGLTSYSDNTKAYVACQLEVEAFLTELVSQLREAGTLDNTVFVITEDHYPYALAQNELAELYDLPDDKSIYSNFDLYRNMLVIYNSAMKEPVIVDEPCSVIDIVPTVANLFGLSYDSRLITGCDILSDTPNTVILNCDQTGPAWNWITRYGSYSTATGKFTPGKGVSFASDEAMKQYVDAMNATVKLKRKYSYAILDNNYYKYVIK